MPSDGSSAAASPRPNAQPRIHVPARLESGERVDLPAPAARHVQVLRLQPGDALTLFNGAGGEFAATVERMGRGDVAVRVGLHRPVEREAPRAVHLAIGMPANERMDWLVEKATELGAESVQPLAFERSVVKLQAERAAKKRDHWQAIAIAACEQCGRNRVPAVHAPQALAQWLRGNSTVGMRLLLSPGGKRLRDALGDASSAVCVLSGPEGGLSAAEEALAMAHGFVPSTLGTRILRAETAPLAALAFLAISA
ncbi:MAG TPA: 16S rRNA (uracil(1498)-N(3))-methyltransferase [Ramlibacter sp.]|uniref:16S rRNA (uracil(1498)-N(3))-methyltransferase n=1 Tax=Ramlibacter sp. TaxID=1917967 RepID=UPI002BB07689|nr:16S rRNA (uracil(1498)-N(3))-methyltransferase [Ramlibacter sp.]HVZ46958.1 16S rRNA (uracil(1498)-N(3))-methyltransferase [Ramlibacter sp.]